MEQDAIAITMLIGVFLIMAGFSCSIDLTSFLFYIKKPKAISIGLLCQFILFPLAAFCLTKILSLEPLESVALILTASCPGGTLSNFWCWFFGTDLELSIAMTSSSSLLSMIFITINCIIYIPLISNGEAEIDYWSLVTSVITLECGVVFGLFVSYKKYNKIKKILYILAGMFSVILILIGIYQNTLVSDQSIYEMPARIYISTSILNGIAWLLAVLISYYIFRLKNNQSVAVCIECSNQNVSLAISIILLTIEDRKDANKAVGVPMLYSVLNVLFILVIGTLLRIFGVVTNDNDGNYEKSGFTRCVNCFYRDIRSNNDANTETMLTPFKHPKA